MRWGHRASASEVTRTRPASSTLIPVFVSIARDLFNKLAVGLEDLFVSATEVNAVGEISERLVAHLQRFRRFPSESQNLIPSAAVESSMCRSRGIVLLLIWKEPTLLFWHRKWYRMGRYRRAGDRLHNRTPASAAIESVQESVQRPVSRCDLKGLAICFRKAQPRSSPAEQSQAPMAERVKSRSRLQSRRQRCSPTNQE
jgi:hypothetical protein